MRKLFASIVLICLCANASAQRVETTEGYGTGYLETSSYTIVNTIKTIDGVLFMLYDNAPSVLLRYPPESMRTEYEVPSTVRRIANNAFQGTKHLKTLKLHNTCTFASFVKLVIGETAFNDSSIEEFEVIENSTSAHKEVPQDMTGGEGAESGRYNISGQKVERAERGVQVVTYTNGTAKKVWNE